MLVIDAVDDAVDASPSWRRRRGAAAARSRSRGWRSGTRSSGRARRRATTVAVDEVVVPEQRARLVDAPLGHQPADPRAADHEVLVADRIDLLGAEAVARAERRAAARSCRSGRGRTGSCRRPTPRRRAATRPARSRTNCSGSHRDSSRVKRTTATPSMPASPAAPRASGRWSSAAAAPCRAGPRAAGADRRSSRPASRHARGPAGGRAR